MSTRSSQFLSVSAQRKVPAKHTVDMDQGIHNMEKNKVARKSGKLYNLTNIDERKSDKHQRQSDNL